MQLNVNNIPKILKDLNIWLCYDDRDKDFFKDLSDAEINQERKAPRDLKGNKCSLKKHFSLNECLDSIDKGFNSGVGIVLNNNGIVCIDYDNCIMGYDLRYYEKFGVIIADLKSDVKDRISRDIDLLNSYTEISPSGRGIHIYLMANKNIKVNINKKDIEIYTNHFMRLSGNLFNEFMYNDIEDRTAELDKLLKMYHIVSDADNSKSIINTKYNAYKDLLSKKFRFTNKYSIKDIKDTMFNSKKGKLLKRLYDNTITDDEFFKLKDKTSSDDVDISDSGKSITLIMHLLHFCYGDIQAVYKIFISSALCKPKYIKKMYANHTEDIIKNQFIPYAINKYYNYSDKE